MGASRRMLRRRLLVTIGTLATTHGLAISFGCTPTAPASTAPGALSEPAASASSQSIARATTTPATQSKPANQGGTLVVAGEAMGESFVPAVTFQGWGHTWVLNNIFEGLYISRDFKTVTPALATGHTVSDDGLVYTFHLRKGVKFHDGTPFNADAVAFNYDRYLDKQHPFFEPSAVIATTFLPNVKSITVKDEYTVEIVRKTPMAGFISALSQSFAGIMSPSAIKKYGVKDAGRYPVGTGPFRFEKAEKGNQASFTAFEDYWGGRPILDRVVIRVISDDQAMTANLLSGGIDVTPFVDFKDIESFRKNPSLKVQVTPTASTGYIGVNQAHPTMRDVRVRRAIAHAVNKQQIIDVIFYGEADLGAGLIPPAMWAYAPQFKDYYPYAPQKAKDLLSEAGGAPECILFTQQSGFWPRMAELLQADLVAVGLRTAIEKIDSAKFYAVVTEGKHQIFIGDGTWNFPDPDGFLYGQYGCNNPRRMRYGYCDPKFDELLVKQSAEQDQEKRKAMLWELQKIILDEVTQISNYYNRLAIVANKRVEGFVPVPDRSMRLGSTYLTKK